MKWQRRRFLRGVGGVALGLPFLEALAPRTAFAAPPKRFGVLFHCNGVNMERWFPATPYGPLSAASFTAAQSQSPLAPYAGKLLIPRGLHMVPRGFGRDPSGGDDHMKGMGHKLTCAPCATTAEKFPTGASIDHVIARGINAGGKGPLNLKVGYSGRDVLGHASYSAAGQPAAAFNDPWKAFKDWVGSNAPSAPVTMDLTAARRRSVLDVVRTELDDLRNGKLVSSADRQKLDQHFTQIRALEAQVMPNPTPPPAGGLACTLTEARRREIETIDPTRVTNDAEYPRIAAMMIDIMALALACDHNRVVMIQFGSGAGGPIHRWCGDGLNQQYNHHKLSHGATSDASPSPNLPDAEWKQSLFNIDQWHATMLRTLLDRLSGYSEPGGSVLDNSVLLTINELGNGLEHNFMDLPVMIAGSAGGYLKQGQYLKLTAGTGTANDRDAPSNQLFTTLANAVGYRNPDGSPMTDFGRAPTGKPGEIAALKA